MSLICLRYALKFIPMGTGYSIWTGISVVGSTLMGMVYFNESKDWRRIFFVGLILVSTIGLKFLS